MAADDLVVIRSFLKQIDAELARGALEAAGIDAMIRSDDCGGTRPHLWMHGVDVVVRSGDVERANEILSIEPVPLRAPVSERDSH